MMNEFWRPVPNFEGHYWISNYGRVKNSQGKIKAQIDCGGGLYKVGFQAEGQREERYISSLMAAVFPELMEVKNEK